VWEPSATPWEPRDPSDKDDQWRLYNIAADPGEQIDLSKQEKDKLDTLIGQWENYVKETGVIIPDYGVGYAH
jgi:arylsulfatase